jgi:bla regulator protein BlaR1
MNLTYLSPLANHLWQSTLFGAVAGLLTLALRRNHARVRCWIWLAASLKFLIPFSALIALGGQVHWRPAPNTTPYNVSILVDQVSEPFLASAISAPLPARVSVLNQVPAILLAVWAIGFLGITCSWWVHRRRIQTVVSTGAVVRTGSLIPLNLPVPTLSSPSVLEPGVFGVFRPVLLLPESIFLSLTPGQLDAVIAHELCHVRHRDNLIATVQMFVETVFWFHPLVWWIGRRMVEERERACDEEVLCMGSQPRDYAEGILKICKLYTESPLVCACGVTGSDLKKRIEAIMQNRRSVRLNVARKAGLAFAAMAVVIAPIVVGTMNAPAVRAQSTAAAAPRFEVASIKPTSQSGPDIQGLGNVRALPGGRLIAEKVLLRYFIQDAYDVRPFQLSGGPAWISSAHYDIAAKAEGNPNSGQMRLLMQALLEDRFKLKVHHETRELPVYELTVAKNGAKLPEPKEGSCISPDPDAPPWPPVPGQAIPCGGVLVMMSRSGARMKGGQVTMTDLIRTLSNVLRRTVIDKTGFTGTFDVELLFTADEALAGLPTPPPPAPGGVAPTPSPDLHGNIFAAIQEQLGLKLQSAKGPVDVLVIDSMERASAN